MLWLTQLLFIHSFMADRKKAVLFYAHKIDVSLNQFTMKVVDQVLNGHQQTEPVSIGG